MQWRSSGRFAFFTKGGKFIKNVQIWDWLNPNARPYLLSGLNVDTRYSRKISIDSSDYTHTNIADFTEGITDVKYQNSRIFSLGTETALSSATLPNREGIIQQGTFMHSGGQVAPIYNTAYVELYGSVNQYNIIISADRVYNISMYLVKAGGQWYYNFDCNYDLSTTLQLYVKQVDGENKIEIVFKFLKNMGSGSHYLSFSNGGYTKAMQSSKPLVLGYASTNYDETGLIPFRPYSRGAFIPTLTSGYNPFTSRTGYENHMYMTETSSLLTYKTQTGDVEYVVKHRRGSATLTETSTVINFESLGTTNYGVSLTRTNATTGDLYVSTKTETSFVVHGNIGMSFDYVVMR